MEQTPLVQLKHKQEQTEEAEEHAGVLGTPGTRAVEAAAGQKRSEAAGSGKQKPAIWRI